MFLAEGAEGQGTQRKPSHLCTFATSARKGTDFTWRTLSIHPCDLFNSATSARNKTTFYAGNAEGQGMLRKNSAISAPLIPLRETRKHLTRRTLRKPSATSAPLLPLREKKIKIKKCSHLT